MYSPDHVVNDIVLTVINDGDGSQCGMPYADRCAAAKASNARTRFTLACQHYILHECDHPATPKQIKAATDELLAYYTNHVNEG